VSTTISLRQRLRFKSRSIGAGSNVQEVLRRLRQQRLSGRFVWHNFGTLESDERRHPATESDTKELNFLNLPISSRAVIALRRQRSYVRIVSGAPDFLIKSNGCRQGDFPVGWSSGKGKRRGAACSISLIAIPPALTTDQKVRSSKLYGRAGAGAPISDRSALQIPEASTSSALCPGLRTPSLRQLKLPRRRDLRTR